VSGGALGLVSVVAVALTAALSPAPAATPPAAEEARAGVRAPDIKFDPISYGNSRKKQMANYSKRHYGDREWRLKKVKAVVLHYTASGSYSSAWSTFNSNAPSLGESPGVCAQYVVDKDGTVYQLTRREVRCRHTIGLNHVSLGIEMVQEDLGNPHRTAEAILGRKKQARSAVRLVAWLEDRYSFGLNNVIGHGMANSSPFFLDKQGWRNDHVDWLKPEVKQFRKRAKALGPGS
jgi:hypothetical protein